MLRALCCQHLAPVRHFEQSRAQHHPGLLRAGVGAGEQGAHDGGGGALLRAATGCHL